ncbi:hypothetical protein [Kitasatospora sp. NPDC058046]|uniref:hypothetical protein n=1 Tax=Kitasatospora sp. NPDC058046 TaxID=3346312 RepID=UPI0036DF74D4
MTQLIVLAALWVLRLLLPAHGQHRAPQPFAAPMVPARLPVSEPSTPAPCEPTPEPERQYMGPLIRPHIDHAAWLAELDEMQRDYNERQRQRERREALRAVARNRPDTGYTYPGAPTFSGAVA